MPLIRLFLNICLFAKGPQDLPASGLLLGLAVLSYGLIGTVLLLLDADPVAAGLQVLLEGFLLAAFLCGVLFLSGKLARWLKTAIALFGCDALISTLALPILIWLDFHPDAQMVFLLLVTLMLWHLLVVSHIFRHALSVPFLAGFVLAFAYTSMTYQVLLSLFPRAA